VTQTARTCPSEHQISIDTATIVGDLTTGDGIPQGAFDCFIFTQTLQFIYDARAAVDGDQREGAADEGTADPGNDAAREGLAPSTTLDENVHPSLPEGDFVLNASFFTKDEARAAFAAFKAEMEAKAGRSLTTDEVVALVMAREEQLLSGMEEPAAVKADFTDEISDGDAFDMLVDGDPSSKTDEVQELTQNDGGVETADDEQGLLMDDVSIGPPSLN